MTPKEYLHQAYRLDHRINSDIEELKLDALEWADENLSIEDVPEVIKAVVAKLTQINKAAPSGSTNSDPKKK